MHPWTPRDVKLRDSAALEDEGGGLRIRIVPEVIWSWGIDPDAEKHFASVARRAVDDG